MRSVTKQLNRAVREGDASRVSLLLRQSSCDALSQDKHSMTALMWAANHGHASCVEILLPFSDPLAQDKDGWTALMWAAFHGQESCIALLIPVSDALAQSHRKMTALMLAARRGKMSCIHLLLSVSDAQMSDHSGCTASQMAIDHGHDALARLIDAYALTQSEKIALGSMLRWGEPPKRAALRV